jgi:hypothetical protein
LSIGSQAVFASAPRSGSDHELFRDQYVEGPDDHLLMDLRSDPTMNVRPLRVGISLQILQDEVKYPPGDPWSILRTRSR